MASLFADSLTKRIPDGWISTQLGRCLDLVRNGLSLEQNQEGRGVRVTRIETISEGKINVEKVAFVETKGDITEYRLESGDVLFSHINSIKHIGKVAQFNNNEELYHGMNLLVLRFNSQVDKRFGYYFLASRQTKSICERMAKQAVNQASINTKEIRQLPIALPPLPEQRKIAEILSTVDETIEKTDAIIQETHQLKKGLMQKLLTQGIGHTQFKETAIGRIPEEWEITQLGDLGEFFRGKTITQSDIIATGLPCIRYGDIYVQYENDHIVTDFSAYISRETAENGRRIYSGDILFAGTGETVEDIGKCVAYTRDDEAYAGGDLIVFRPEGKNQLNSIFLSYCLNSGEVAKWKSRLGQGLSIFHIYARNLKTLIVPVPSVNEQHKIAEIFCEVDAKIKTEQAFKSELEHLKKGLMQVLLTGKVRVKV